MISEKNRSFLYHTLAAVGYNGAVALLILSNNRYAFYYTAGLFLVAGLHLIILFISVLLKIRRLKPVGFTGFSILSVFLVHVIFWLLFVNLP